MYHDVEMYGVIYNWELMQIPQWYFVLLLGPFDNMDYL